MPQQRSSESVRRLEPAEPAPMPSAPYTLLDEVIVLEAGRVVQRGTHAELLISDGPSAEMWQRESEP